MTPLTQTLLITLGTLAALMILLWLVSLYRRDASIVDPFWGMGFVLVVWLAYWWNSSDTDRGLLLAVLTSAWGIRLSSHLLARNLQHGEDRRYGAMRAQWGHNFWWVSLFTVFLLQGVILWFISFPLLQAMTLPAPPLTWRDLGGGLVWSIGFGFEAIGDWQLTRFKSKPENQDRVMDQGLWRYTRHPNYFGDCCLWWGLYLLALPANAGWTIGSPLLMTVLLTRVSGVTLLERSITDRRPEYASYRARTSAFLPWPPRSR